MSPFVLSWCGLRRHLGMPINLVGTQTFWRGVAVEIVDNLLCYSTKVILDFVYLVFFVDGFDDLRCHILALHIILFLETVK